MKAAKLLVRCLEWEGVHYIFGLPGEENMEFLQALRHSRIRFIPTRDERGAAFMANVYGRLTGKAGVCLSTLGPGATNLVTGLADAHLDHAPVVAITAQAGLDRIHKESHQYINILEAFRPFVKWNARIETPHALPEIVRKAFKQAQTEKPGAAHIEFPEDIALQSTGHKPIVNERARRPSPDRESLERAVHAIETAQHPILLAGNGAVRGRAGKELLAFSQKTRIPIANTFMSKGIVPADYELSLITIGIQAQDYKACGFDRADLIIAIGYDFAEYAPKHWNPEKKQIVHIDVTPSEVDEFYTPVVEVVADIRETLELLAEKVRSVKDAGYANDLRIRILQECAVHSCENSFPVKPQRIIRDMREVLGRDDIIVSDVGAHKIWIARMFPAYEANTVIISNGLAAMGIGVPGALAAKIACPEKNIVAVCGDGGFTMTAAELETAVRMGVAFTVIVFNDCGYGLIRWKQHRRFGEPFATDLGYVDCVKLAESFGAEGTKISSADELMPALLRGIRSQKPYIIDVAVDYSENFRFMKEWGALLCS